MAKKHFWWSSVLAIILAMAFLAGCSPDPFGEQLPEYIQSCKDAVGVAATNRLVSGKFILVDWKNGVMDDVTSYLPKSMVATSTEEAGLLACLEWESYLLGTYSDGSRYYGARGDATVIDLSNRQVVAQTNFSTRTQYMAPEKKVVSGDIYSKDVDDIVAWLKQLNNEGRITRLKENHAQRIVALNPEYVEMLFAMGAGGQVVGRPKGSVYPEEAQVLPEIRVELEYLDEKGISSLNPDLVLASDELPAERFTALDQGNFVVLRLPHAIDFETMFSNMLMIAELNGHQEAAEELIAGYRERITAVEAKIATVKERPLIFYEIMVLEDPAVPGKIGGFSPGSETIESRLIHMAGGENLGDRYGQGYPIIPTLDKGLPEIILLGDLSPEEVAAREGWQDIPAIKSGRVYQINNLQFAISPRLVDTLEALARLIHPEVFE